MLNFISNVPNEHESQSEATEICGDNIQNKKITILKKSPKHTHQRNRQIFQFDLENII